MNMKTEEYIVGLRKTKNIIIVPNGDELKIKGPQKELTMEILDGIKNRKLEIVNFFKSLNYQKKSGPVSLNREILFRRRTNQFYNPAPF